MYPLTSRSPNTNTVWNRTGIAKENKDLETFQDRYKTYCEVRPKDTTRLLENRKIWTMVNDLRRHWRKTYQRRGAMRKRSEQTKFKVLVYPR